jgi:hypothetical protein
MAMNNHDYHLFGTLYHLKILLISIFIAKLDFENYNTYLTLKCQTKQDTMVVIPLDPIVNNTLVFFHVNEFTITP